MRLLLSSVSASASNRMSSGTTEGRKGAKISKSKVKVCEIFGREV